MTISLVSTVQTSEGSPATHSAITGIATGDLYIDLAHNTGGVTAPALDTTSTFTTIDSGTDWSGRTYAYGYRKRTGSEGTLAATGTVALVDIFFGLTGVDATTQVESVTTTSSVGTTYTVSASTPTANNCWHVLVISDTNSDATSIPTPPTGYAQLATYKKTGQGALWAFYKDLGAGSSGVSTGSVTVTFSGGTAGGQAVGFIVRAASAGGATVSTITGTTVTEGSPVVFTVTMSGTGGGTFAYSWSGTATSADYTTTLTNGMFTVTGGSGNVTVSGSNITVDSTVTAFTVTVPTTGDTLDEPAETIWLVIGGVTASSGTIIDNSVEPFIVGTRNSKVTAGSPNVITYTITPVSSKTITTTLTVTPGTALATTNYISPVTSGMFSNGVTISGSTVTIPPGVASFTLTIPTIP